MIPSISRAPTRPRPEVITPTELHLFIAEVPGETMFVIMAPNLQEAWSAVCDRYKVYHTEDLPFGTRVVPAPLVAAGEVG